MSIHPMSAPLAEYILIVNNRLYTPIIGDEHRREVLQLADAAFMFIHPQKRDRLRVVKTRYTPECVSAGTSKWGYDLGSEVSLEELLTLVGNHIDVLYWVEQLRILRGLKHDEPGGTPSNPWPGV